MDLADHKAGSGDSVPAHGVKFSHGKDRFCFSRYVSGLHQDRGCMNCPHLYECSKESAATVGSL